MALCHLLPGIPSAVDADRIGLWGTSYAGGHALVLGATERRLKAVVAQIPTISGYEQSLRRVAPDQVAGWKPVSATTTGVCLPVKRWPPSRSSTPTPRPRPRITRRTRWQFYHQTVPEGVHYENKVTVRSIRAARMYEPGQWVSRVSPTPLLMIIGLNDTITLADTGLAAYERALQPKKLVTIPGGHFDAYHSHFATSSGAARDWFLEHLA